MAIYKEDIVDIDLAKGSIYRSHMSKPIGLSDNKANRFGVRVFRNGEKVNLGSVSVQGFFRDPHGNNISITQAEYQVISDNVASVILPQLCYNYEGQFTLAIKLVGGGITGTMRIIDGMVDNTNTTNPITTYDTVPTYQEILAVYEQMEASLESAVRFDEAQELEDEEQEQARENISAASLDEVNIPRANMIKPLFIIQMISNLPQFRISSVRASREGVYYVYTITTLQQNTFSGCSITETGTAYENYIFNYEHGCNNVGTPTIYKYDDTIVSGEITGYAALVIDRSDYTIKIISTMSLNGNHRVIALFFSNGDTLQKSLTGFGTNGKLFGQRYAHDFNRFYLQNGNGSPIGALTLSYNESTKVYTVTRNNDTFFVYGFTDWDMNLVGVGAEGISNLTYPMPSSFSSSTGIQNFAAIVADRFDNTTTTWHIVDQATLEANKTKYIVLGFVYRNKSNVVFFEGIAKDLFTNYLAPEPEIDPQQINGDLYKAFKKVGVIGDSLSVGFMYNKTTETAEFRMLEYSWPKVIMKTADVPWLNLGTSGQGTLTWYSNSTYGKVQAEASGNKCQAYIICLGQNDQNVSSSGYAPLGTTSDITDDYTASVSTYYGGYSRIIALLKHINPDCKIFCVTNPMSGGNRAAYNEAIKYIANTYYASDGNVMLADLASDYGYLINNGYLLNDYNAITGGHYSAAGYSRIATIMEAEISLTMERNVLNMWDVAFIPYDTTDPTANTMTE